MRKDKKGILLDIGCGSNKQPNWVGMDHQKLPGVDIVHSWDKFPWPIETDSVLTARASHVIEHVNPINGNFINWMNEVWRILKYDGQFTAVLPHGRSDGYIQDPTHCNPCNETTWSYFDPLDERTGGQLYGFYQPAPWKIEFLAFQQHGNMEIILSKRRDDPSYHHDGKVHYGKEV